MKVYNCSCFIPSKQSFQTDDIVSFSQSVLDFQSFCLLLVFNEFSDTFILRDNNAHVSKSILIGKPHLDTTQRRTIKSFPQPKFQRVGKHSCQSENFHLRSQNIELIPFSSPGYTRTTSLLQEDTEIVSVKTVQFILLPKISLNCWLRKPLKIKKLS